MAYSLIQQYLYHAGFFLLVRKLVNRKIKNNIRILYSHRVLSNNDHTPFHALLGHLNCNEFEQRLGHLEKYYNPISLQKAYYFLAENKAAPINSIVLTFDDGYCDIFQNVLPLAEKYKIPFTVFLSTGVIGKNKSLWFQQVFNILSKTTEQFFICPWSKKHLALNSQEEKVSSAFRYLRQLKLHLSPEKYDEEIEKLATQLKTSQAPSPCDTMLSWEQVKYLSQHPLVSLGPHTVNHYILTNLSNQQAEWEIEHSTNVLEEKIGKKNLFFCYPNGHKEDFNNYHIGILKKNSFQAALSSIRGLNDCRENNLFALKRIGLDASTSLYVNALYIAGWTELRQKSSGPV